MPIIEVRSRAEAERIARSLDADTQAYVKLLGNAPYVQAMTFKPKILRNMAIAAKHGNPTKSHGK